jgi:hypothetical protein
VGNRRREPSIPAPQNAIFLRYRNHLAGTVFRMQTFYIYRVLHTEITGHDMIKLYMC